MKTKLLLFLMLSVLFTQAQTTPKKTDVHKGYKMAITNASARFITVPMLTDDEKFPIINNLGKEKFIEILQNGYSEKYPTCFEHLLVNNDVKALENFIMYVIEITKIRNEYYAILEIPYDENKNVANCSFTNTVYIIIKSAATKTLDEYAWLDEYDSSNHKKSLLVKKEKPDTRIISQNVLENEVVKSKTNLEKNSTDDSKKKEILQIFSDYYKTLHIVKQKAAASKAFDYEKDKDKYCQFYQGLKIAYDDWDKAYDKLSTEVKNNDNLSKYLTGKEYSDAIGVEMQHYLDNTEYYPILSAFKTNCTSLKEQIDKLNAQTKVLDRYNKSI